MLAWTDYAQRMNRQSPKAELPSLWFSMLCAGMAGALGWGIRGQYGHESGAMIAGALLSTVLVTIFLSSARSLNAARAISWTTVGISFGGCLTYGQTVGLTHDPDLVGNWGAWGWGMLGLAIKGGLWIGFAGMMLGIGFSSKNYRPGELGAMMFISIFLMLLGIFLLNEPFDPSSRKLPAIYFSDHWRWEPDKILTPRPEKWGGLLLALSGMFVYLKWFKKDKLVWNLMLWGVLGGGLGFPLGQSVQSFHAWNSEWFANGPLRSISPLMNWWNWMETIFGFVMGATLALGLWVNRKNLNPYRQMVRAEWKLSLEWAVLALHLLAIAAWNFISFDRLDAIADLAIPMGVLPIAAVAGGRIWPFLLVGPVTLLPIAGKTFRELSLKSEQFSISWGFIILFCLPMLISWLIALKSSCREEVDRQGSTARFLRTQLLSLTWIYFLLNWVFFDSPWPWMEWTARTPNAMFFLIAALTLTFLGLRTIPTKAAGLK